MELPLLESVPNVSVGRDAAIVEELVAATCAGAEHGHGVDGSRAALADVHRDSDHDRSVFTIVGRGEALACALEHLARATVARLDLHAGHGVHPRIGALDVLPVVPLERPGDLRALAGAHELAARLGAFLGNELGVPVIRYGLDSLGSPIPGAETTGAVRRGGTAGVTARVAAGELALMAEPQTPQTPHPSAGMTICGVRDVLVAFNVDLDTEDLAAARSIAARIREIADGRDALPGVRALGLYLASRQVAQVSTNVEQHAVCGPARVIETVARIADELGIGIAAAELVGLAPDSALVPVRYACTRLGVPLRAGPRPSLDEAAAPSP